ncbi:MAG: hypothetical protein ACI9F9_000766 [Candidatus Paceibacteria bacterium]|jgi:hypothetical protein
MTRFRLLTHINSPEGARCLGHKGYIDSRSARYFEGDSLAHRFARALASRRAVPMKEVLESFEFFAAVRREVRGPVVADLCAGHGLVGVLFALYEREVERVLLVDHRPPESRAKVLEAAAEVGPWTTGKIEWLDRKIDGLEHTLPSGCTIVSVHACGHRTDTCIELAQHQGGPIAVMPCCRSKARSTSSAPVARELGHDLAIDIDRTYRLEASGLHVRWSSVPECITPMNRILIGRLRGTKPGLPAQAT